MYSIYSSRKLRWYPSLLPPVYWRSPLVRFHLYFTGITLSFFCHRFDLDLHALSAGLLQLTDLSASRLTPDSFAAWVSFKNMQICLSEKLLHRYLNQNKVCMMIYKSFPHQNTTPPLRLPPSLCICKLSAYLDNQLMWFLYGQRPCIFHLSLLNSGFLIICTRNGQQCTIFLCNKSGCVAVFPTVNEPSHPSAWRVRFPSRGGVYSPWV